MKFPHTHFTKGKKIRIVLRNRAVMVRRFVERSARHIEVLNDTGESEYIHVALLRNISIYKNSARVAQ